jgi:TRAP-type C4-dicarboxylate transport system substrate-binding protein
LIATVALAAMCIASAQEKTIKFANQNVAGHPIVQGMEKFKKLVEKTPAEKSKLACFQVVH